LFSWEDELNETPQQYAQRILGYAEGKAPLGVQTATAKKLDRLIKGCPRPNCGSVLSLTNGQSVRSLHISAIRKSSSFFV
jgi:hypothetical protein